MYVNYENGYDYEYYGRSAWRSIGRQNVRSVSNSASHRKT